ncbi:MAG: PKD domain-containing protein, partial [Pseudomonadota bacterium]
VAGYDRNLSLSWTEEIPGRFAQVRSLGSTRIAGSTLLWAAGRTIPVGDTEVPTLWAYSEAGQLVQQCDLQSRTGTTYLREILQVEQGPLAGQLELIIRAVEETTNTPRLVRLIIDTSCTLDLASFRELTVADDTAFLNWLTVLPELPTFGVRTPAGGGAIVRTLDVVTSRRVYRFDIEAGALLSTEDLPVIDVVNFNPTGIAVDQDADRAPFTVMTGDAGQIQAFDADSQQRFNIALQDPAGQTLRTPVIDSAERVWIAGEETPLLRVERNRDVVGIQFPECFWVPPGFDGGRCTSEISDIDDGSVNSGWVHLVMLARESFENANDREDVLILSVNEDLPLNARVRRLDSAINFPPSITTQSLDTLGSDDTGVTLVHLRLRDGRGLGAEPSRSGILNKSRGIYHYGTSEFTRWSLNTLKLALHDAVLAHDGGVVLLLNATGDNDTLSFEDAQTAGLSRNLALVKLSAEGNPQWGRIYGTAADDVPVKLERTAAGYAIAALSDGVDALTPGSTDLFVIHTGFDGRVAADASGTDACQAALLSEDGVLTGSRLSAALGDSTRSLLLPLADEGTVAFSTTPVATVTQSFATSPLTSDNTARQCSGSATNIQESPDGDGRRAEISLQVFGSGDVAVFSGDRFASCDADCSIDVVVGAQQDLRAQADDGWRFNGWTGSPLCTGSDERILFTAPEGITQCIATFIADQSPPSARFNIDPPGGFDTTTQIEFDASASTDIDGMIVGYSWDFNADGIEDAIGVTVTRVFDAAGDYEVTLTVTDDDGLTSQQVRRINVVRALSAPPTAAFTVTPGGPTTLGTILTLDAGTSTDDIGIVSWFWDVGDDGSTDATGEVVQVTPPVAGMIPIRLRVLDADGQAAEIVQTVEVTQVSAMTFTLRVEINGNGGVDISPLGLSLPDSSCDGNECFIGNIAAGTQLTLSAFGFTPSFFTGWPAAECDQVSGDDCVITMNADRSVTANFQ